MSAPVYRGGRPFVKPGLRFGNNTGIFNISSAPVDGTAGTLAGVAGPGSILMRTNGAVYVNTNTKASPTWVSLGVGATGAVLTSPTITTPIYTDRKVLAATATYDNTSTLADLTGFSWTVEAAGVYEFELLLNTTMTITGGLKVAFALVTATLTSIRYNVTSLTASAIATATGTTTTSGTAFSDQKTTAFTRIDVRGSFVVNAGGTFKFQAAQNTAAPGADASSILIGSTANLFRVS